jgi:sterol 3beta-glucosyltransferase
VKVLIVTVGSRGDVAPFTGLGTSLQAAGHSVTIASYPMFSGLITGCGLGFRALPGDPWLLEAQPSRTSWTQDPRRCSSASAAWNPATPAA